ncbi:hypothetical protein [Parasitella parasitica]|uniref:ATP-dependent DNA helicase n=1 Tax=Parasitella parasitica TaxID=35722 RepID=A0A0B7NDK1_9FUNG|nr:hypothetical protein [Parasitella parasitica]
MRAIGRKVILPSTIVRGPRFMPQLYQDATNLVRRFGKPDLFIIFTCNPAWPQIFSEPKAIQGTSDRPDLCAPAFHLKLKALVDDIVKHSVLAKVEDKPRTPEDIDNIVSAEIPDLTTHPLSYETVSTAMIHGPCGLLNPEAPCVNNGMCSKRYMFAFYEETTLSDDEVNGITTVDNRWIVPHNLYLMSMFNAHINIEICNHGNYVKCIYKYIYKGHDCGQVGLGNYDQQDKIKDFLDAINVSSAEACWRVLSYSTHKEFPSCQWLDVRLPIDPLEYFDEEDKPAEVLNRAVPESTLTAWLFQTTARATGLLADDSKWSAAMTEKALFQSANFVRKKIYILIAFSGFLSYSYQLWDLFPSVDTRANGQSNQLNTYERMHDLLHAQSLDREDPDMLPSFNESQALLYSTIRDAVLKENPVLGLRIFFIDGPGGTDRDISIAIASSGTAALLFECGRTIHSTLKILLDVTTRTRCDMTPRSDESSMVSKNLVETVNRPFQDVMDNTDSFGLRLIVFGGDFRQVLPIISGASRSVIINDLLMRCLPGRAASYVSSDRTCNEERQMEMPIEVLDVIGSRSLPPHKLELKVASSIMVLQSIDPAASIFNGTRLIVNSLGTNAIKATIATGPNKGDMISKLETVYIYEIDNVHNDF